MLGKWKLMGSLSCLKLENQDVMGIQSLVLVIALPIWTVHKELGLRHSIIMGLKGWKMHRILLIFQVILPTHLCLMKSWSLSRKHSRMMNVLQLEGTAWSYICLVLSIFGFISLVSRQVWFYVLTNYWSLYKIFFMTFKSRQATFTCIYLISDNLVDFNLDSGKKFRSCLLVQKFSDFSFFFLENRKLWITCYCSLGNSVLFFQFS